MVRFDDNRENLKLGMSVLEEKYDVITAPTVKKMQKILENNRIDVILMNDDTVLPANAKDIPVDNYFMEGKLQ